MLGNQAKVWYECVKKMRQRYEHSLFYSLEDADGTMLAELAMLSCQHKDVFYTLICNKTGADLGCILRFSKALKKLT